VDTVRCWFLRWLPALRLTRRGVQSSTSFVGIQAPGSNRFLRRQCPRCAERAMVRRGNSKTVAPCGTSENFALPSVNHHRPTITSLAHPAAPTASQILRRLVERRNHDCDWKLVQLQQVGEYLIGPKAFVVSHLTPRPCTLSHCTRHNDFFSPTSLLRKPSV